MSAGAPVPVERIRDVNAAPLRLGRPLIVYWMHAHRRLRWNQALARAVELARAHRRPLLVVETIACDEPWASDRHHAFVLAGMAENRRRLLSHPVTYLPLVERRPGEVARFLRALGPLAAAVVTDDFPGDPAAAVDALGSELDVRLEAVDAATVFPFRLSGREFSTAYLFRRQLQRHLPPWLGRRPAADPLHGLRLPRAESLPAHMGRRWPAASAGELAAPARLLASLPIDHAVAPVGLGGSAAAEARLAAFLDGPLDGYLTDRDQPDLDGTSGLSAWLHHGHLAAEEVAAAVLDRERWSPGRLADRASGAREGWWGLSPSAEAFLDQLVTWRELGIGWAAFRSDHRALSSLPAWALATLRRHARDPRRPSYTCRRLEAAETHDPLWNAAQRQLIETGTMHNRLRMLWGKKILEWSRGPEEALEHLFALNDRWALDGRDPSSASGVLWCLGRHDRAWGPERPIFGTVRYMSSENAARKHRLRGYLSRFSLRRGNLTLS
jgi:deoxyribodipyrimidine photo-lyase